MRRHWIRERQAFAAKVFITILCIGVYTCLRHSAQFALFSANLHAGVRSLPHSTLVDLMGTFLGPFARSLHGGFEDAFSVSS